MPKARASSTTFVDIDSRRVLYIADGRDAHTVAEFADHLEAHKGDASHIKEVCIDMSGAFIVMAKPCSAWTASPRT